MLVASLQDALDACGHRVSECLCSLLSLKSGPRGVAMFENEVAVLASVDMKRSSILAFKSKETRIRPESVDFFPETATCPTT